ncbi:mucin-17 isoform X2 [Sipha flava]|uniref:Mucin-17 isoform X2 n=2 Tax=Sipha flava TaxID=143950 RepID=A0A8B8GKX3_9HEMI|nr:mucin-17 isoform X2 [Sipha flava]
MPLDMALGSTAPMSFRHRLQVTVALLLIVCVTLTKSAPATYDEIEAKQTDLTDYFNDPNGCYYNYQHYEEGDRIVTNEPCLNCTCHNRMLMCYLRVCPFSKAIGQDCTVQKSPDQCCPVISCPEVPVHLLTSSTTTQRSTTTTTTTTEIGWRDDYGCMMNENGFFPDGAQVPSDPKKPCELCYCIRNRTACVMQECTLHVEGCRPVYQDGVCCPVRYDCDYESEKSTTSTPQLSGGLVFSTTSAPFDCKVNNEVYRDGESITMVTEKPCEHCYCMRGDIVCAVQDCGEPLRGKDCTPETPPTGQCCPTSYQCPNETMNSYDSTTLQPVLLSDSDGNEAEKFPTSDEVYEKLGENQPSQQDDKNDVDSDQIYTTVAYASETLSAGTSDQTTNKNEESHESVPENHNTVAGPNILPENDSTHTNNEDNKPEHSSTKPELINQVNPIGTESDTIKYESTNKPLEPTSIDEAKPTQSPAADPSLNENIVNPTTQTIINENSVNEGNNNNESPVQSQDSLASSSPTELTETSVESETQSSNTQDKPQEGIQQQTDTPVVAEKEPIKSSDHEQNVDIKSPTDTSDANQNNEGSTENYTGENNIITVVPLNEDTEQTTTKLTQLDNVNTPLGNSDSIIDTTSSNIINQNNSDQSNQEFTQSPQEDNLPTNNPSNVEQNLANNDKIQEENVVSTEIPNVVNEPSENKPQNENISESEITSTKKYQENPQEGNTESTEIPKIENKPNEQNKPLVENDPETEKGPESEITPTEPNQDDSQSENYLPTEIPKIENKPTEQDKPLLNNSPQTEIQPESVQTPVEPNNKDSSQTENATPTEISKLENESTEQNKPLVENSPHTESQPESDNLPTEQNHVSVQGENISPTELPKVGNQDSQTENAPPTQIPSIENEPTEQNKPLVENIPQNEYQPESGITSQEQNQNSNQNDNALPTEIPKVENKLTEQNKHIVENSPQTEIRPESDQSPTEQNQDSTHNENASPTQIPSIENEPTEQNKPLLEIIPQSESQPELDNTATEQNKGSAQGENVSPTETSNVENETTENSKPLENNIPGVINQLEAGNISTEQKNQDNLQSENVTPTDIPNAQHESVEQNKPIVESNLQTEHPLESDKTSTEQIQDSVQGENVSLTEFPKVESEPTEQNKPLVENSSHTESQLESDNKPTEQNQGSVQGGNISQTELPNVGNQDSQSENVSPTQIPSTENEPTEQNKPLVESSPQAESQPEPPKTLAEENQKNPQVENVSSTEIPSKLNEPQSENAVTENILIEPVASVVPVNDIPTEHSIEHNNIFIVAPTSPSLFSQNQIKGDEPTSTSSGSEISDKITTVAEKNKDKIVINPSTSADDKPSPFVEKTNMDNVSPLSSTEIAPESNNILPQTNDENTEHSTETKPVENGVNVEVSNDVTIAPVDSHDSKPIVTNLNNKFGSNNLVNSEPSVTPTTESNHDVNLGITNQDILVDDVSSQENDSVDEGDADTPALDPLEHQIAPQTESPTETESSTNEYPSASIEHINDFTTSLPQQQVTDNNIPVIPVESINPSEPVLADDKTETPTVLSENTTPKKSEVSGIQHSDDISKPTESPVLDPNGTEQFVSTQNPVLINENESVTPHVQSQDENVNEIEDQTSVYPDTSSNNENNLNSANGLFQNNIENSTPLSDKVETSTNAQNYGEEPIKNNDGAVPLENENSTISQAEQVNQGSSENADNIETTNSYTEIPSLASITNAPASISDENDVNPSLNPANDVETNVDNNRPATIVPQQSIPSDETSTQYITDDSSTNGPIQETPNVNLNNNIETGTNIPPYSEIPNEVNQDSVSESESYTTQSPTETNFSTVDSNKTPENDATMEAISNLPVQTNNSQTNTNEIINGNPSETSDNAGKPTVSKKPDYVIDITTVIPSFISGSIETEDQANAVNDVTTSNIDKNSDTTELYDNVQAGVPGEGSCLIDFVTYAHKSEVPKSNPCHEKCECLNSIVTCTSVNCPPAPPQHRNCIPLHPGNESWCCPSYMCEGGIEGVLFESNNQLGSPQLISTVVLEDKPGEENDDKTHLDEEVSSTPSPQIASEYNTLPPSQTDKIINSQDSMGMTEVSTPSEIINKPLENEVATDVDNNIPTTTNSLGTVENDKPTENDKPVDISDKPVKNGQPLKNEKPVESDKPSENEKPVESDKPSEYEKPVESDKPSENEKPVESDKPSENEKPVESDKPSENEKPVESDQPSENEKPVESDQVTENEKLTDDSEADVTTASYADNEQKVTNKPEVVNNIEEQNTLPNAVNESQDNLSPSTEIPSSESAITNIIPTNDQNLSEQNVGSDDSVTATTYKPNNSIVDQQIDDNKTVEEDGKPTADEKLDAVPVTGVIDLPSSDVKPLEVTQTPTIIADANPTAVENNVNGLRPTSIDDIISSVNMVKDAVKNSLETSSKPAEIDYQTTTGLIENYQLTVVPENAVNPSSENVLVDKYDEPQTTSSSVNTVPELQTDDINEKLPERPDVVVPSDEVRPTQVPDISPSVNADQGTSTELPSIVPDKQEIPTSPNVADINVNQPEGTLDDKIADVTTIQNVPNSEQDQTSNGPIVATSNPVIAQADVESNTNLPEVLTSNDKAPEITTQVFPSSAQQEVLTDDTANRPAEQEKPIAERPISQEFEVNADGTLTEITTQSVPGYSSTTEYADAETSENGDKRFGVPSSSPAAPTVVHEDNKRPQESSGDVVNIPLDTEEKPLSKPSSSTPTSASYASSRPQYTPIPQSTWTQKPFHQDSTSEAPQPDQGFPDEYDDENEAVYGPGTCRYGGKIYVSAQQVPREDPCDFCFCFRGDIICLQQSCPPPIFGCYQENIQGFCCPRYECPVAQATSVNVTTTTTTTTTMVPPHFFANAYRGAARRTGCLIHGHAYRVGEDVGIASGPCLECICGADGKMKCDPKPCSPEPMLRKIMAEAVDQRKR